VEPDVLDRFADDLHAASYDTDTVLELLGQPAHRAMARGEIVPALRATTDGSPLSSLIRLFLLGASLAESAAVAALPHTSLDAAIGAGLLERVGDEVRAAVDIRPHADENHEYLVMSDLDSDVRPGPLRQDHVLGIGSASLTLVQATIRQPVGTVLDIGVGCGIQSLHCSTHAARITGTDVNPRALRMAAATARLNGQHWELLGGSLFEPVPDRTFDLIVSNPPFVVSAGEQRFSYRDSGVAGDGLVQSLLADLRGHLNAGGTAQLLANWLVTGDADWRERIGTWVARTGLDGWVVQRELADPVEYVGLWLKDAGEDVRAGRAAEEWLEYFERERVRGIGMGVLTLRNNGSADPSVTFDELTGPGDNVTGPEADAFLARQAWLAGTSDLQLLATKLTLGNAVMLEQRAIPGSMGWSTVYRLVRRLNGPGAVLQVDEWTQGLLAGCRGEVPLAVLLNLFADAHGFDLDALTAAVLPAVRHAISRGVLEVTQP
jgi:methylase of polypeptide subunit release factors